MTNLKKQRSIMFTLIILTVISYLLFVFIISFSKKETYHGAFMKNIETGVYKDGYIYKTM